MDKGNDTPGLLIHDIICEIFTQVYSRVDERSSSAILRAATLAFKSLGI